MPTPVNTTATNLHHSTSYHVPIDHPRPASSISKHLESRRACTMHLLELSTEILLSIIDVAVQHSELQDAAQFRQTCRQSIQTCPVPKLTTLRSVQRVSTRLHFAPTKGKAPQRKDGPVYGTQAPPVKNVPSRRRHVAFVLYHQSHGIFSRFSYET
jgi:hypothetical protein